jgi:hypothetical protein
VGILIPAFLAESKIVTPSSALTLILSIVIFIKDTALLPPLSKTFLSK